MSEKPVSIFVATPMYGGACHGNYTFAALQLQEICTQRNIPINWGFLYNESLVQRGRNELVARFLNSDATHLVFIDADIGYQPLDVLRLIAADLDIVGATYPRKRINWDNIKKAIELNPKITNDVLEIFAADYIFKVVDGVQEFKINEPVEVYHVPTGFLCIKREVFEHFVRAFPDIEHTENNTISGVPETRWAFFECGINETKEYLSEDFWFCKKARELGYKIHMLGGINLSHAGTYNFKGNLGVIGSYMEHEQKLIAEKNKKQPLVKPKRVKMGQK